MKIPVEDTWMCPVNVGAHWILVIVKMLDKVLVVIDPLGKEGAYERKVLRNWRNYLQKAGLQQRQTNWTVQKMPHDNQQDAWSCGILVLMFAEAYLEHGNVANIQTSPQAVAQARMDVACALLQLKGNAADYCLVCSHLQTDGDTSMIEMVQCDSCSRWAHFECVDYGKESAGYICKKCA